MVRDEVQLRDTQRAFDRVADRYDGPAGNNELIQQMRLEMWKTLGATFPPGARLLDLGCGTGIDAAYLASNGYSILAADWSPEMVERTQARVEEAGLAGSVETLVLGAQDLGRLGGERLDGMYSNLGPLNCVPDLRQTARACADLLEPGGRIVTSIIGRVCPWEVGWYLAHGDRRRAFLRWRRGPVPVPLDGQTVWTRYYTPREFYDAFSDDFVLTSYRGLRIFAPPPYLLGVYRRARPICSMGEWLDGRLSTRPGFRNAGDHFLMTLTRRG